MRNFAIIIIVTVVSLCSCTKEETVSSKETFIKSFISDSDMVALACFETTDNNIVAISRHLDFKALGWIVKTNSLGEELWRKKLPIENKVIWNAIPIQTGGFITVGYNENLSQELKICKFDNDGNLLPPIASIPSNIVGNQAGDIIALSNGNYALTYSANVSGMGYIKILNSSFNTLHARSVEAPNSSYFGSFFRGMQQVNDSTIALTASTQFQGSGPAHTNTILYKTNLNGSITAKTFIIDSTTSETANCLALNKNGLLSVTSTMKGFNSGNGVYVDLFSNNSGQLICGRINLLKYNDSNSLTDRKEVSSHPLNGIIISAKKCKDDGFILCGTVNLNNSQTNTSNSNIYLMKLDANLNFLWSRTFNTIYQSYGVEAFESMAGGFCLVGHQRKDNRQFNMILIKTDDLGNTN